MTASASPAGRAVCGSASCSGPAAGGWPPEISCADALCVRAIASFDGSRHVDPHQHEEVVMFNWLKTAILMAGILALFGAVGGAIGGSQGMITALVIGAGMNLFAYWFSDKLVLRMYSAQEVDETSAPQLYGIVKELAARGGIPMPRVYVIDQPQPNAFATGRNPQHAAVAATTGILRMLTPRE